MGKDEVGWTERDDREAQTKDIVFVERLIEKVSTLVRVDGSGVHVSGHSSGGFFGMSLWALRPDISAAGAPVACYGRYEPVEAAVKRPFYAFGLTDKSFDDDPPDRIAGVVRARRTIRQNPARNGYAATKKMRDAVREAVLTRTGQPAWVRWRLEARPMGNVGFLDLLLSYDASRFSVVKISANRFSPVGDGGASERPTNDCRWTCRVFGGTVIHIKRKWSGIGAFG